jgi:hypothetical protein
MNPHSRTPAEHAEAAAEAIRWLNHATIRGGYEWPSDVDDMIGQLLTMVERLPQALDQAGHWLAREYAAGRIGVDDMGNPVSPDAAVTAVESALGIATADAMTLAADLRSVRRFSTRLTGVRP